MKLMAFLLVAFLFLLFWRNHFYSSTPAPVLLEEPSSTKTEKTIEVSIDKNDQVYTVEHLEVRRLEYPYFTSNELVNGKAHHGVVTSFNAKALGYFTASEMIIVLCMDEIDEKGRMSGGCEEVKSGKIKVLVPFFPNGKYATIYNPEGKKVTTIDLTSKATCNEDNKCDQPIEDSYTCPHDCKGGKPVVQVP